MYKKRVFLIIGSALVFAVVAVAIIGILSNNSMAHANEPTSQAHELTYPDPTNQSALPDSVKVTGSGETVLLRAAVTEGHQIYECQASTTDPSGFAWKLQAPFAFLKADDG